MHEKYGFLTLFWRFDDPQRPFPGSDTPKSGRILTEYQPIGYGASLLPWEAAGRVRNDGIPPQARVVLAVKGDRIIEF